MKAKLLKRIRKRFDYYFNKDGEPILIDLSKKEYILINMVFYRQYGNFNSIEDARKSITLSNEKEVLWRLLKDTMLRPFGYKYGNLRFNYARRRGIYRKFR